MWICVLVYLGKLLTDEEMRNLMPRKTLRAVKRKKLGTEVGFNNGFAALCYRKVEDDVAKQFFTLMVKREVPLLGKGAYIWEPYFQEEKKTKP